MDVLPRLPARALIVGLATSAAVLAGAVPATASAPAAAGAGVLTVAPTAATDPALARYYSQQLDWQSCLGDLQCAWLTVPLDYAQPDGTTIGLRISRVRATGDAASRIGSLVVNPGGPGASGLDFASYVAGQSAAVARQFDVVGFDTRGVGRSVPITCMTGAQTTRWLQADPTPDTAAEQRQYMALAARIPAGCLSMSPDIARHVGSENTVRDLDILRQALGDERLNWLGYSYGTYLGTHYAEEFPDRVGRFVLDGALDPSLDGMQTSQGQSTGFQTAITRFAADCAPRAGCPWRGSTERVLRGINQLLARLDAHPMPAGRGRPLVQAEALSAIFYSMYSPVVWPSLRVALRYAANGNGRGLQTLSDYANERVAPNRYGSNMASAFPAIACWDSTAAPGRAGLADAARRWSRGVAVPEMAVAMSWGNAPCTSWYGHSPLTPAPASSTTTAPILVVGTTYDPATPYRWAQALSRQLTTATLLTYRGDGHTAYGGNSRCIDAAVDAYLLTGAPPAAGTVCR